MSFLCLRAVALQRAGVKTGIQAPSLRKQGTMKDWIPACAGMTKISGNAYIFLNFNQSLNVWKLKNSFFSSCEIIL
jgi:hypothetical protein